MYAAPPTSLRPASQILQRVRIFRLNVLRDQQSLATWLLIGAALQCSLLWLPLATRYIILPTIAALTVKLLQGVVAVSAYRRGKDNIATSRPMYPNLDGRQNNPGSVCVLLLGFRIMQYVRPNTFVFRAAAQGRLMLYYLADSPLGLFAPGVSGVIKYFDEMAADLDVHADKYGYLGAKRYLSAGDAARINEICSVFYFDSHEAVLAWAYAAMHMKGWLWWNGVQQKYPHLGLMHEMYDSPEGMWEATYVNYPPSGLGGTTFPVDIGEKQIVWQSSLAAQGKGARSSLGRMGRSDGTDNDIRAPWPYGQ